MNHTMSAVPHGHYGIVGDYTLGALLGSGSFGSVHHVNAVSTAAHERLAATPGYAKDMSLAIKVLRVGSRGVNRHDLERRFNREVELLQTAGSAQATYVLRLLDSGFDGTTAFMVSAEFDHSLEHRLALGPLTPDEARNVAFSSCFALAAMHQVDLIHGDLKPANMLVDAGPYGFGSLVAQASSSTPHGRSSGNPAIPNTGLSEELPPVGSAVLADFGIARDVRAVEQSLMATPWYAAPEFVQGDQASAEAALRPEFDLFGLGAVLFECVAGERWDAQFQLDDPVGLDGIQSAWTKRRQLASEGVNPTVPTIFDEGLREIIMGLLDRDLRIRRRAAQTLDSEATAWFKRLRRKP